MPDTAESLRYSLSPEALQARGEFVRRMEGSELQLNLMIWRTYMQHFLSEPDLPVIVMASSL